MSKIVIIYTSHRQFEEIKLSALLLQNTKTLRRYDLIFHCNKFDIDIKDYFELFPNPKKELIHTSKNTGYRYGAHEALADMYEKYKNYDFVIHLHSDVFIIHESGILKLLETYRNTPDIFICTKNHSGGPFFDFFIFKPKKLPGNIFKKWEDSTFRENLDPENLLLKMLRFYKLPYALVKRYHNDKWYPRRRDILSLWHEHKIKAVIRYIYKYKKLFPTITDFSNIL